MWKGLSILLVGVAVGALAAFAYQSRWPMSPTSESTSNALGPPLNPAVPGALDGRRSIMALGTLEPVDGIVHISSPLIGYRIKNVPVQEGQLVMADEVLVELDPVEAEAELQLARTRQAEAEQRQEAEIALAKQRVASAELAVQQAEAAIPLEIEAQRSRISVADLKVEQSRQDLQHLEELRNLSEPLASEQQVQHQRVILEAAEAERAAAQVALKRLEQSLAFQQQTAAAELRAAHQALLLAEKGTGVESLKQAVTMSQLKLAQTKISSPTSGSVLNVIAHPGEIVAQQPLLQMADLDSLVCIAEIDAADIPFLRTNHQARITSRAFQDTVVDGKLARLGNQVTKAAIQPLDPRKPVDRNVAKAVILLDSEQLTKLINTSTGDRRSALIGLQVEVEFPLTAEPR